MESLLKLMEIPSTSTRNVSGMYVAAQDLPTLICSKCSGHLSCSPVYIQQDASTICGRCSMHKDPGAIRNEHYEKLAHRFKFPCKYQKYGCSELVSFSTNAPHTHEENCDYRDVFCPIIEPSKCNWMGRWNNLLKHCRDEHSDKFVESAFVFKPVITIENEQRYFLNKFDCLFLLYIKVCLNNRPKIYYYLEVVSNPNKQNIEEKKFNFTVEVETESFKLMKSNKVVSNNNFTFKDNLSICINMKEKNIDNTVFTVNINKIIMCTQCSVRPSKSYLGATYGWLCKTDIPPKRTCIFNSEGCTYIDIDSGCIKHETLFCPYITSCILNVCDDSFPQGSLFSHIFKTHVDIDIHTSGSNFPCPLGKKYSSGTFLIASIAGIAVCNYTLIGCESIFESSDKYELNVSIPLTTTELHEYNCEIYLSEPTDAVTDGDINIINEKKTYLPDIHKNLPDNELRFSYIIGNGNSNATTHKNFCDWNFLIPEHEISIKSGNFNICVNIFKLK